METTIKEIHWIQFIVAFALIGCMIFFIAFVESKLKVKDIYFTKQRKLIGYSIALFIVLLLFFCFVALQGISIWSGEIAFLVLCIKILIAFVIGGEADRLGRNKYLWGSLAFLEFHFVLLALGLGPKLLKINLKTKKLIQNLNNQILEKEKSIKQAFINGIIDYEAKNEKLSNLKKEYSFRLENINLKENNDEFNSKLDLAFKNGIITEEEFLTKKIEYEKDQI